MVKLAYYNKEGQKVGTIELDEGIFGKKIKKQLLHELVIAYEANRRQGTASTKTRAEVKGSSKKPWPQKHTGRARAGSIRSPIWRHGGVAIGPKPRDWSITINKKARVAGLNSALLGKLLDTEVSVIEAFNIENPKTKLMSGVLKKIGLKGKILIGLESYDRNIYLSARNIPSVTLLPIRDFNAYELLRHKNILLTHKALTKIVEKRDGKLKEPVVQEVSST